jgi:molybdopterin/thiamine biosynthesis adenylyltransferase
MVESNGDGLFAREELAGYSPEVMARGVITFVGAGAGANNEAMNCALSGVGELRFIDFDHIERSNLPRSPLFSRTLGSEAVKRYKARELALRALDISYATDPVVRYAIAKIEALGLGALVGSNVVVGAVDSMKVQGFLADACQLLRIPFVPGGFSGHVGQFAVFPNASPEEPCLHCAVSSATSSGISCATYASAVQAEGGIPATQPLAATVGALMAEAAIRALHGEFDLGGKMFSLDIRTGESQLVKLVKDPACTHRHFSPIRRLDIRAKEPLRKVLEAAREFMQEPKAHLTFPFVLELPCRDCGAALRVQRSDWEITEAPRCPGSCAVRSNVSEALGPVILPTVGLHDELSHWSSRKLGLPPGAIFELEDGVTGELVAVQLAETADDLFITKRRRARNGAVSTRMENDEAAMHAAEEK